MRKGIRISPYWLAGLATVAGVATIAFAAVKTDFDHKVDFGKYHTYSWIGVSAGNSLWGDRIKEAVDGQLTGKAWTQLASNGEAAVSAFGKVTERDTLDTFYTGFPGWGWREFGAATTTVVPERVGNLVIDVFDGQTKKLIWRATASDTLSSKAEKNDKKLEEAVEDMFKHFPPLPRL